MKNEEQNLLPSDYPFQEDVARMLSQTKSSSKTMDIDANTGVRKEKYTFTVEREYLPLEFTKIYQNKEVLSRLSPNACKIIIYISMNVGYEEAFIRLLHQDVGLDRRAFNKAMIELMAARVLSKQKKSWYWINITIIVVGRVKQIGNQ